MISFHVPLTGCSSASMHSQHKIIHDLKEEGGDEKEFFSFALQQNSTVLFAGSRHQHLSDQLCHDLVSGFGRLGFSFIVGCANGVDASFRSALADSDYLGKSFVAVCYPYRLPKITDLSCDLVVPDTVHPRQAPRVRTLYMVDRCSLAIVFADDPKTNIWGKGSTLAINACIKQDKPVFVVTSHKPTQIDKCHILPTSLFGAVRGYFIISKRAGKITRSSSFKKEVVA